MQLSPRQTVEFFHLVFLRALVARGEDKSHFALKGGCNLRFYFDSIRYSEDIDLDVVVVARETLKNKVDRLLASPLVKSPLRSKGVELVEVTAPKQTETTQRWKAGLRCAGSPVLRTKIEFSRRDTFEAASFEPVSPSAVLSYGLPQFLAPHYAAPAAIAQKVRALVGRAEPQARDVFDLNLLLSKAPQLTVSGLGASTVQQAIERAMEISFDDYTSTVIAYLDPEQAAPYEGKAAWSLMQESVIARLEELSP